jgi:ATP-dependent Zn protease
VTTLGSGTFGRYRLAVLVAVLVIAGLAIAWDYLARDNEGTSYAYSAMLADAGAGRVASISQEGTQLAVLLVGESAPRTVFVASDAVNVYAEVCAATGKQPGPDCAIQYEVTQPSASAQWVGLIITALLPVVLIGGFIFFMMRSAQRKQT